ncbi:ABC transporter permease [Lysinibacillus pakistanensis]|uniref:ABC transporter permease n=1 Tax=Lysinibacillus pakistanensis TaxID=759811 RepID=A0AAX3WRR0_9BACI|nr:ABC transporter permease [Lysinibacillus pakistanensis]MDM5234308.1 ABC transporter permease [Lysinibacillus pakistanensis]WHY44897.1 ABC transporter permease [Lysinibacillus pakistanensis]WHY49904.1 ABC transporter permease [Lysinibacillus pakistanensis]
MLSLIQTEFLKLKRKKFIWFMFIPALLMPLVAVLYFKAGSQVDLTPIKFYRWTAFSYTTWLILPFVLGMLITMLVYQEVENNLLTQLWIVPVGKLRFIISKFCVMWLYSICFMLICASGSIVIGSVSGLIEITNTSVLNLILKCLEIGALLPFGMIPILALATTQKGYILPVSTTIVYVFFGFILLMGNMYLHPLSSVIGILMRNIEGVVMKDPVQIWKALLSIALWSGTSIALAINVLRKGKVL